jgi:hypothetical protein
MARVNGSSVFNVRYLHSGIGPNPLTLCIIIVGKFGERTPCASHVLDTVEFFLSAVYAVSRWRWSF